MGYYTWIKLAVTYAAVATVLLAIFVGLTVTRVLK